MLFGQELKRAIEEMGLTERQFAAKCVRADGTVVSSQAVNDLIRKTRNPERHELTETEKAVEAALKKACRLCGHYTEKPHAWRDSATPTEGRSRKRRT
jgi:hypothetical protein